MVEWREQLRKPAVMGVIGIMILLWTVFAAAYSVHILAVTPRGEGVPLMDIIRGIPLFQELVGEGIK